MIKFYLLYVVLGAITLSCNSYAGRENQSDDQGIVSSRPPSRNSDESPSQMSSYASPFGRLSSWVNYWLPSTASTKSNDSPADQITSSHTKSPEEKIRQEQFVQMVGKFLKHLWKNHSRDPRILNSLMDRAIQLRNRHHSNFTLDPQVVALLNDSLNSGAQFPLSKREVTRLEKIDSFLGRYFLRFLSLNFDSSNAQYFRNLVTAFNEFSIQNGFFINANLVKSDGLPDVEVTEKVITEDEWTEIALGEDLSENNSLLSAEETSSGFQVRINPKIFTNEIYSNSVFMAYLSYLVAKEFRIDKNYDRGASLQPAIDRHFRRLKDQGIEVHVFEGKTGAKGFEQDDATAIAAYDSKENQVFLAFHGSISGKKVQIPPQPGPGDWGANYDSNAALASSLNIEDIGENVWIHQGFGYNFQTIQQKLYEYFQSIQKNQNRPLEVIVVGHSKGGAMASLAAPILKTYLSRNQIQSHVRAILFSAPRAYFGRESAKWVHQQLKPRNIVRINVKGDPAPLVPRVFSIDLVSSIASRFSNWFKEFLKDYTYQSVGYLLYDNYENIQIRMSKTYGAETWNTLSPAHTLSAVHYVYGGGFNSVLVPAYDELEGLLKTGRSHTAQKEDSYAGSYESQQ